jgi:hypothetical protein
MREGHVISAHFSGLSIVRAANVQPVQAQNQTLAAPMIAFTQKVETGRVQISRSVGRALDNRARLVRELGLADLERGKSAAMFHPAKDGMMLATAMAIPAAAPVYSAIALATALSYAIADRKGAGKTAAVKARIADQIRADYTASSASANDGFYTDWSKTGYHTSAAAKPSIASPANSPFAPAPALNDNQAHIFAALDNILLPLECQRDFQILMRQQAQYDGVQAANDNRAIKGVELSRNTLEAAITSDLEELNCPHLAERNLPGCTL